MMPKTATFCSPSLLDTQELCRVMARVIALDRTECADSYRHLNDAFSRVSRAPFQDDFVRKPRALIQAAIASPGDYPGIDFPCWLEPESGRRVTVMLVGQDPVRDATYFTVPATEPYVVIGTPYSVHSQALRSWRNNPRYWMLIQHLLDAGYMLYLSDIAKAWPSAEGGTAERIAREILEYEIALVAPTLVVTFGSRATQALLGPGASRGFRGRLAERLPLGRTSVLPVLHPSRRNTHMLAEYLQTNGVDPGKGVVGIAEIITNAISGRMS